MQLVKDMVSYPESQPGKWPSFISMYQRYDWKRNQELLEFQPPVETKPILNDLPAVPIQCVLSSVILGNYYPL